MGRGLLSSKSNQKKPYKNVRYIVAVAAGKGGVGKSTVSANLALTLQKMGYDVGVFDADIYGPSMGLMMPLEKPIEINEAVITPGEFQGVKVVSMDYFKESPLIVRAPVANGLILECIEKVEWGELDYLIVDFPPGTGDVQLTLMQSLSFSCGLLVTMPQEISLIDVRKAAHMFHHMGVAIGGVVENMSYYEDAMGHKVALFGEGGGKALCEMYGIPSFFQVPLQTEVSKCGDQGLALPMTFAESSAAKAFEKVAVSLREILYTLEKFAQEGMEPFEFQWKENLEDADSDQRAEAAFKRIT